MDEILLVMCNALSCFAVTVILFQFMEGRYKRSIRKKQVYILVEVVITVFVTYINLMDNSLLNFLAWLVTLGVSSCFLYYEDTDKPLRRMLESEALLFCIAICEILGVFFLQWFLQILKVQSTNTIMLNCIEVIFPTIIIIFFYYMVIIRLMKKSGIPYSRSQYVIYTVMLGYSFVNMMVSFEIFIQGQVNYLCVINMGCTVLADLYLLYFIKMADEKNYYENQVKALEQQANMQYEYYLAQSRKYEGTVQILHDVKKHIKAIKDLYTSDQENMRVK